MNKVFRTVQDLVYYIEKAGYSYSRSAGSHQIYSANGKQNIVLVCHGNPRKERVHPKAIKHVLQLVA